MSRSKSNSFAFSNLEFISSINKYIPALVLQNMIYRQERKDKQAQLQNRFTVNIQNEHNQLPELQPMETVCLFADISGFTNLSEACANMGVRGNEELAFCINRYMEGMVKNLGKYGGDIIKFVGDAMIVMWPPDENSSNKKQDTVRKAIQCALDIQKEMGNLVILKGVSSLSVKIGIGYGKCALLYVGGVFNRAEFFTVGEALKLALKSEGNASGGGEIIVAEKAFECVKSNYEAKELGDEKSGKFYLIKRLIGEAIKARADGQLLRSQFKPETFVRIQEQLRFWVPAAIIPYLQIGAESFGSETRSLTVMFLNLGVDLSSADTQEGMTKIQKIVTTVQQQIYRLQGSVNKLVMDDKGSTFICLWGVCPLSHEDDAARAILTGFNIIRELDKIEKTTCKIGISSGECFSGVVGTTGSRKEFSVLGDVVNLAARIMGSLKYSEYDMCTDINTRNLASNFFNFNYVAHKEFKGKSISIPIFQPIDVYQVLLRAIENNKTLQPEVMLFAHNNPLIIDRTNDQKKKLKAIGFENQILDLSDKLIDFCRQDDSDEPFMAVIKGEIGSGKTTFLLNFIEEITISAEFKNLQSQQGKSFIYTSTLNAETELEFLNIWRPVLQMMLINLCKRNNLKKEKVIKILMSYGGDEESNAQKLDVLCSILGIKRSLIEQKLPKKMTYVAQIQRKKTPFPFVSRCDYEEKDEIIELLLVLVKMAIGETEDISIINQTNNKSALESDDNEEDQICKPVSIVILDNAHMMDAASWKLFEAIRQDCQRIAVIMCLQTDEADKPKISSDVKPYFEAIWISEEMENLIQIDMPFMDERQLEQLIIRCGPRYQISHMDEVTKMTEIVDPEKTIKNEKMGIEWTQRLHKKWQLTQKLKGINPEIVKVIVRKCSGNPLISLGFFQNMLHNEIIQVDQHGQVNPTYLFNQAQRLSDWKSVPVPRLALKMNVNRIDKFIQQVRDNPRKKPGDLEACITSIVILKAAVVLGEEFELRALKKVQPLQKIGSEKMLLHCLKFLEQYELIEILDETDNKNVLCRFSKEFLRESLYQILLFRECKQQLHTAAAEYLQNSIPSSQQDPEIESERLKYHMLKAQDITFEKDLSYQSKTGLIVRRLQNLIIRNPKQIVFKDFIYKEARATGKISQRLCSISAKHFRWYHDEDELRRGIFMGSVPLNNIITCVASITRQPDKKAFSINTTLCIDKNLNQSEGQTIDFCCNDEESRDTWVISIDFLKTRAVYEEYASKNIPVQFPLRSKEEDQDQVGNDNDISDLLFDFAQKLKGRTFPMHNNSNNTINLSQLQGIGTVSGMRNDSIVSKKSSLRTSVLIVSNEQRSNGITAVDLIPKLKSLYNSGIVSFMHHMSQNACKMTVKQQNSKLGQLPDRATIELARSIDLNVNNQSDNTKRGSINSDVEKFSDEASERRIGRRKSSVSAEPRRNTARFEKNGLIKEEESYSETSSQIENDNQRQWVKHDAKRKSNATETNIIQLLKESNDDDVSKQIKKINADMGTPSQDSTDQILPQFPNPAIQRKNTRLEKDPVIQRKNTRLEKAKSEQKPVVGSSQNTPMHSENKSSISNNDSDFFQNKQRDHKMTFAEKEKQTVYIEEEKSKNKFLRQKTNIKSSPKQMMHQNQYTQNNSQQNNSQDKINQPSTINFVEESTIHQNLNASAIYQDLSNDNMTSFSDQQQSRQMHSNRLQTGQFGEEPHLGVNFKPHIQVQKGFNNQSNDSSMLNTIQQLIKTQLGTVTKELMNQNQILIESQQKQINQQMAMLNQSLTQNQMFINQSLNNVVQNPQSQQIPNYYPQMGHITYQNVQAYPDQQSPQTPVLHGMRITSKSKRSFQSTLIEGTPSAKHNTEQENDEPEDPEHPHLIINQMLHRDSLDQEDIQHLYHVYPQMLQQLQEKPQRQKSKQMQKNNEITFTRQQEPRTPGVSKRKQEQFLNSTPQQQSKKQPESQQAKYMHRLYQKQKQIRQEEVPAQKHQFFPLPEHMWDENLANQEQDNSKYVQAIRKTQCQLIGDMMEIPVGTRVRIVEKLPQIQMQRVAYGKRVGLFLMKDFKPFQEIKQTLTADQFQHSTQKPRDEPPYGLQIQKGVSMDLSMQSSQKPPLNNNLSQSQLKTLSQIKDKTQQVAPRKNFFAEKGQYDFLY